MKDLVGVFKILNLCADRVDQHPIYITPMIDILKICSLPFLKEKSSDETAYEQIAVESVAQLGKFANTAFEFEVVLIFKYQITIFSNRKRNTENG